MFLVVAEEGDYPGSRPSSKRRANLANFLQRGKDGGGKNGPKSLVRIKQNK